MSQRPYRGCDSLYPASGRLNSVPPMSRFDYEDEPYPTRGRSMARRANRGDVWVNARYGDMLSGEFPVNTGHKSIRSPSEFSRDLIARSRSPSPFLKTINNLNMDLCEEIKEKMFHSKYKAMYPETYRGSNSIYNSSMGRNMMAADSPQYRYYRYNNSYSDPVRPSVNINNTPRYRTRTQEIVFVPVPNPAVKLPRYVKKRVID